MFDVGDIVRITGRAGFYKVMGRIGLFLEVETPQGSKRRVYASDCTTVNTSEDKPTDSTTVIETGVPPGVVAVRAKPTAPTVYEQRAAELKVAWALVTKLQAEAEAERAKEVEKALEEAARKVAEEQRKELTARIDYETYLAAATIDLLAELRAVRVNKLNHTKQYESLAKFRKELQPLASTYGATIMPVGNGTLAVIVVN